MRIVVGLCCAVLVVWSAECTGWAQGWGGGSLRSVSLLSTRAFSTQGGRTYGRTVHLQLQGWSMATGRVGDAFGVHRRALSTDGLIAALPTLIVDFLPLLGNVVALSSGMGRFGWGIAGMAFGTLGSLFLFFSVGSLAITVSLIILQALVFGLSLTNFILGIRERQAQQALQSSGSSRATSSLGSSMAERAGAGGSWGPWHWQWKGWGLSGHF